MVLQRVERNNAIELTISHKVHGPKVVIIDKESEPILFGKYLTISKIEQTFYAMVHDNGHRFLLHRLIMKGKEIDHRNRNGLDCRKENLRPATRSQNSANKPPRGKSKYKGVVYNPKMKKNKWLVYLGKDYVTYYGGSFSTEKEAAKQYDKLAKEKHGEFAYLNFPSE